MTDSVRASGPADVLSFVLHALGSVPRESFVLITLHGTRLGATLRIDAPLAPTPAMFARTVADYLAADTAATSVLLAVYTDVTGAPELPRPFHEHVEALIEVFDAAGTPLKDGWLVTSTHWQNLLCDGQDGCCPAYPLEAITDSALNAEMVYRGSTYNQNAGATYAPFTGPANTEEAIIASIATQMITGTDHATALWANALRTTGQIPEQDRIELLATLQIPAARDLLLCNIIDPERTTPEGAGDLLMGKIAPDWTRVDKAQERARELINAAPGGYRAPLLTMIGWTDYLKGRASSAANHFTQATADSPGFRLAELLAGVMNLGTVADIAMNPATAYKPKR